MNCIVVVLVGGKGTRIHHLLPDLPKPLAPVFGHPFLEWILRFLAKQRLRRIVFSTGYLAEKIQNFVEHANFTELELSCVREEVLLGTAGGLLNAIDHCGHNFEVILVLNGDSLVLADLTSLLNSLQDPLIDAVILGVEVSDAQRYGTLKVDINDMLIGFEEKNPGAGLINAGVYLFRKKALENFSREEPLSFEMEVFPKMLADNLRIKVVSSNAPFIDIGTEDSLKQADLFIQSYQPYFY
jgi:D-glycero-alpha-D-manno-heptose 1-phosphate guanylyltransferase